MTPRELATVLAALRYWPAALRYWQDVPPDIYNTATKAGEPLTENDGLCERLNA